MSIDQALYYQERLEEALRKKKKALIAVFTLGFSQTPLVLYISNWKDAENARRGMSFASTPIGGLFKVMWFLVVSLIPLVIIWIANIFKLLVYAAQCHELKRKIAKEYKSIPEYRSDVKSKKYHDKSDGLHSGCWILMLLVFIGAAIAGGVYYFNQQDHSDNYGYSQTVPDPNTPEMTAYLSERGKETQSEEFPLFNENDEDLIIDIVRNYSQACANNDYSTLEELYAPFVERYISKYNLIKDSVLSHHRRYDDFFRVHGKHSSVRWNTLEIRYIDEDRRSVEYIEDYSIDREDASLYSVFVRKMNLILNEFLEIVSVEETILEKGYSE